MRAVTALLTFLKKPLGIVLSGVAVLLLAVGLYWFQPWKLWVDETVNDALPTTAPAKADGERATPSVLATGELISHEHATKGSVRILQLADGKRTLRLEGLDTSNGPDLRVLVTDAPVKKGTAGWRVFDDAKHISLGKLKGNKGEQNYDLPAEVDLAVYTSVSIWCDRFDVSFGAAELKRAA